MQEALKNPHYKKIWEKVIMNRHPSEETLIDALLIEADYDGCLFIENGYIGTPQVFSNDCGYAYAFNFCSDYDYDNNRKISFYDYKEHKRYNVKTGVLEKKYTEEILNKERVLQHILGRPITLEDILIVFTKKDNRYYTLCKIDIWCEKEPYTAGFDGFFQFLKWQLTTPLHEQNPKTWEKIAELI